MLGRIDFFIFIFYRFHRLTVVELLFCSLTKGVTPKSCRLCFCSNKINKRSISSVELTFHRQKAFGELLANTN